MKQGPLVALTLFLIATPMMTACSPAADPVAQAAAPVVPAEEPAASVQVAIATTGDMAVVYSYTGELLPKASVSVIPATAGRIESVLVEVGDKLRAGDPIAIVESRVYAAQLKQAEAGLEAATLGLKKMQEGTRPVQIAAAQAAVQFARNAVNDVTDISDEERTAAVAAMAQAEAALRLAQADYDRIAWAGQVGMTREALMLQQATIGYDAAQAGYELQTNPSDLQLSPLMIQLAQAEMALALALNPFTQTDYDLANVQVKQAEAAVDLARVQLDETVIRAPFDGIVAEIYITEGSMVGPQSPAALFVSKELEVVFNVEESRISQVTEGQYAALQVTAYPDQDFPGVVTSVAPIADANTHTFAVKVTALDEDNLLRSGMYADLSLLVEERQGTVLVPRAAMTEVNGQEVVYVVKDNLVERRAVTSGLSDSDNIEILTGLEADETIVTAGQASLENGTRVEVMTAFD
jgi:HlyD family secretion protein